MTAYILQAILFQLLFLLVYEVMLKKETFFSYNRWYLLSTVLISLLLPMVKIEALSLWVPAESLSQMSTILLPEVFIGNAPATDQMVHLPAVETASSVSVINPWIVIYFLGLITALVIVLKKYNNLSRMFRYKKISAEGRITIIEVPNSNIACTFYRTVFLGDKLSEDEKHQILSHELVHVKQKHSLDLVFFEVLKVIFWFNPLIYIYQNRIATVHEFIADAAVVKVTEKKSYYEQLLNSAFNTQNISFINQFFNHSLIKKRIIMLQRSRSKSISKIKYFILIPMLLLMLTYVACSEGKNVIEENITNTSTLDDEALRKMYLEQITHMEESGASKKDIENKFFITFSEVKSREDFYKSHTYLVYFENKDFEKNKVEENNNEKERSRFSDGWENLTYDEFLEKKSSANLGIHKEEVVSTVGLTGVADIPFAVVNQVPIYPGCEDLGSNDEQKKCTTERVQEYVTRNFNTDLGKQSGLKGILRINTVFKISPEGKIIDIRVRAPHPDLEAEAKRVIASLQQMIPGMHNGQNVGVSYALPIILNVVE